MKVGPTERIVLLSGVAPEVAAAVLAAGGGGGARVRRGDGFFSAFLALDRRRFCDRPRHLFRALFGDDDITLLFGGGLVVDALERIGHGLARGLAGAGRIEFLAEAGGIRKGR